MLAIVWAVWLLAEVHLEWTCTYFVVTDQRVIYRTGVISRHGVEIPLERINNINFRQGIWERIIGAGDLEIQSAGERGHDACSTTSVTPTACSRRSTARWRATRRATRAAARDAVGKAVADALDTHGGGGGGQNVPEQIEALGAACATRATSPAAEYEKKKAELLEKM